MKTKTKEVYYCEYCKKHGLSKSRMEYHETICFHNPKNSRPCFTCNNLEKTEAEIYGDHYNGSEWTRKLKLLHCKRMKKFLYTPQNEIKENYFDLGDEINDPMPTQCDVYEEKEYVF